MQARPRSRGGVDRRERGFRALAVVGALGRCRPRIFLLLLSVTTEVGITVNAIL